MQHPPIETVGDLTSQEKGSAARFSEGKAPLELIPLDTLSSLLKLRNLDLDLLQALDLIGQYQMNKEGVYNLYYAYDMVDKYAVENNIDLIDETAKVLDFGRKKYAEWNWIKGQAWSVCFGCLGRHFKKILVNPIDSDSGLHHVGHIGANLVFLMEFYKNYPEGDDRCKFYVDK
jgi:hypothetical protein